MPARVKKSAAPIDPPPSVRGEYEAHGVKNYYRRFGSSYQNPHEPIVRRLLERVIRNWKPDLSRVLDLAAGSGEVTLALRELGAGRIDAVDPHTLAAYAQRTGEAAEALSFEQIAAGALDGRSYSLIVCSFALHLCDISRLPGLAYQLSRAAPSLLILTPNKRPILVPQWGWKLSRETIVERVRARLYQRIDD